MVIYFSLYRKKKMKKPAATVAKDGRVCDNETRI